MSDRGRAQEQAYVHKTAQSIDRLLAAGDTHPRMREIQMQSFLEHGYDPKVVAEAFGVTEGDLERLRGAETTA